MNMKNSIIERLLKFGKRHRIFIYPVLAIVAIISFFCNMFNWRSRSGKRAVAIIMTMVLFVSQSYFMTSSADNLVDDEQDVVVQEQLQADEEGDSSGDLVEDDEYEDEYYEQGGLVQSPIETVTQSDDDTYSDGEATQNDIYESVENNETSASEDVDVVDANTEEGNTFSNDEEFVDTSDSDVVEDDSSADVTEKQSNKKDKVVKLGDPADNLINCNFHFCDTANSETLFHTEQVAPSEEDGDTYDLTSVVQSSGLAADVSLYENTQSGKYKIYTNVWYTDSSMSSAYSDLSAVKPGAGGEIHLFCKRELAQYRVYIEHSKINNIQTPFSTSPSITSSNSSSNGVYEVDINNMGQADQYGDLELTSITRDGYTLDSVISNDGTIISQTNDSVSVRFTGGSSNKTLTLVWKPNTYNLNYKLDEEGTIHTQEVSFDGSEVFESGVNKVVPKTGYVFSGKWSIPKFNIEVSQGDSVAAYQSQLYNEGTVDIEPINEYDDVTLTRNSVSFEYKKYARSGIIQAKYKTVSTPGSFTYTISSASQSLLAQYGISVVNASNAGFEFETTENGPTKSTAGATFSVEIQIVDNNAPTENIQPQYINVSIAPKNITIQAPSGLTTTKVYDGNTSVPFASQGMGTLPTTDPDIEIEYDCSKVEYNSKNVEEANRIIFSKDNLTMKANNGENISNYNLVMDSSGGYSIPGTITPKKVIVVPEVVFANGRNYVRAGEDDRCCDECNIKLQ